MEPEREPDRVPIIDESDIVRARQAGRSLSARIGFSSTDQTLVATAISELARNIVQYAGQGEILLSLVQDGPDRGVLIVAHDQGPGISDPEMAMRDGHSTGGGLGLGLPGARRLADEFELETKPGGGTRVTLRKWLR